MNINIILTFAIIFFSLVLHEVSHGQAAKMLGDNTAEKMGRLSLNPLKHIDPVGTIIVPLLLVLFSTLTGMRPFVFGWAKPVPVNPFNLKNPKRDMALIALSGPASNLFLALIFGLIIRFGGVFNFTPQVTSFLFTVVFLNILWAVFNLVPLPPLDGSKILFYFLKNNDLEEMLSRYSMMFLVLFIYFGIPILQNITYALTMLLIGV